MPVLLVRHAHAMAREHWEGDDSDRPLSERGRRQAELLAAALVESKPERILSSPAVRCRDTVAPLARAAGLPVEDEPRLAEGAGRAGLSLVRAGAFENLVLCSHGDVIPELLEVLAAEEHLDLGPRPRVQKGSVWVLHPAGSHWGEPEYLPPPA